jgi:large subunit ribosomal protein L6
MCSHKLHLLNNFNNCNFIFYKNIRKNQKFLNKQIYSYLYTFFKSIEIGTNLYFKKILVLNGIGYQFLVRKNLVFIQAGSSHLLVAKSLFFSQGRFGRRNNLLRLRSLNLSMLASYVATLRNLQPPDIYKGKGIRYLKEVVRLKVRIKKKS